MTWNLEADIDLAREPFESVIAWTEFFAEDLRSIKFEVSCQQGVYEETLVKENLMWQSDTLSQLQSLFKQHWDADTSLSVGLGLHGYGDFDYNPYPEIYFLGSQHPMRTEYRTRRMSQATLDFGNHKAYQGRNRLPVSQRCLDTDLIIKVLRYLCQQTQPKNLYLLNEESVSIPWNYHFIFHNYLMGYIEDVAEIIQLMFYGGDERYQYARRNYKRRLSKAPMMFCKRIQKHTDLLKQFIAYHGELIQAQGLPQTFSQEQLESAISDTFEDNQPEEEPIFDFFFVGEGLGIYSEPLIHYGCELFYLSLIEQLDINQKPMPILS